MSLSEHGASEFSERLRTIIRRHPRTKAVLVRGIQTSQSLRHSVQVRATRARVSLRMLGQWLILWPYSSRSIALHNLSAHLRFRLTEIRVRSLASGRTPASGISVHRNAALPALAWLARRTVDEWVFTAGQGVEVHDHGVFEGVWDGDFSAFRPDSCTYAFGSGAVWTDGELLFVPPRHLEECLFALHREADSAVFVSNSLPLLFTSSGVAVGSSFFDRVARTLKTHAFEQGRKGVDRVRPLIAADNEYQLYQCSFFNFLLDDSGRPVRQWVPASREFDTYEEYVSLLERKAGELFANGSSPERRVPLAPVATISSGYDSTATAVVAAHAGCRDALTLKVDILGHDDCGTQIGQLLGLSVTERAHVMGPRIDNLRPDSGADLFAEAAEFMATFGIGDDIMYLGFEQDLPAKMLVTGTWGDSIWAYESDVTSGLPVRVLFGKSLTEFRLRVGFAHLPLPFIGGRFAESAKRLSRHSGMREYSVGGDYDRPIPRRIVEEAGVPRGTFARRKLATAPLLKDYEGLFGDSMSVVMQRYSAAADAS